MANMRGLLILVFLLYFFVATSYGDNSGHGTPLLSDIASGPGLRPDVDCSIGSLPVGSFRYDSHPIRSVPPDPAQGSPSLNSSDTGALHHPIDTGEANDDIVEIRLLASPSVQANVQFPDSDLPLGSSSWLHYIYMSKLIAGLFFIIGQRKISSSIPSDSSKPLNECEMQIASTSSQPSFQSGPARKIREGKQKVNDIYSSSSENKNEIICRIASDLIRKKQSSTTIESPSVGNCVIPRLPEVMCHGGHRKLSRAKPVAPICVSIGPYHHNKSEDYDKMESQKLSFLSRILREEQIEDALKELVDMEDMVRKCYKSGCSMDSAEFVSMLLLDACFIYCKLGCDCEQLTQNKMLMDDNWRDFVHDVLLLENQIPLLVVEKINYIFKPNENEATASELMLKQIALAFKSCLRHLIDEAAFNNRSDLPKQHWHILHLVHSYLKPPVLWEHDNKVTLRKKNDLPEWLPVKQLHSAVDCYEEGISFRERKLGRDGSLLDLFNHRRDGACSLLDVLFSFGTLYIPKLTVDQKTLNLLHNLSQFERQARCGNYVTAYLQLLAGLVRIPDDVSLLSKRGIIINNHYSDEEVIDLIRNLYEGLAQCTYDECYLEPLYKSLDMYYHCKIWKWLVLVGRLFTNLISFVAFLLPASALLGTIFGVLKYFQVISE